LIYFKEEKMRRLVKRIFLERRTKEGNSPVFENHFALLLSFLSTARNESLAGIRLDCPAKTEYSTSPIVN